MLVRIEYFYHKDCPHCDVVGHSNELFDMCNDVGIDSVEIAPRDISKVPIVEQFKLRLVATPAVVIEGRTFIYDSDEDHEMLLQYLEEITER